MLTIRDSRGRKTPNRADSGIVPTVSKVERDIRLMAKFEGSQKRKRAEQGIRRKASSDLEKAAKERERAVELRMKKLKRKKK